MSPDHVIGAVCARGGSKGVPRKALRALLGTSLLERTIRQAEAAGVFDSVVVSTDDPEIAAAAEAVGAEVPFLRPADLARDDSPKWPVFQHLILEYERHAGRRVDVVADLDVGTPLRAVDDIRMAIRTLAAEPADVVITAYVADRNPYFNMVEVVDGLAVVSKACAPPMTRRQDAPVVYALSPAVFAMSRDFVMEASHWSEGRVRLVEIPRARGLDIDEELDFRFAEFLLSRTEDGGWPA